jgi:TRAP-type transport system small permease protein
MQFLRFMDSVIGAACRATLYVTLGVVFAILSINVALRYVAGTSISWASELPELMFPWLIMAGVILAAQHGSHIAVVIFTQKLGAARRWVLAAGSLVVAVLYASLAFVAWPLMEIAADERTPILQVPGSVGVGALMLGFLLLSVVTLCKLPEVWHGVSLPHGHDDPAEAAVHQGA